ncbi:MAG TPA: EAL domain-containing protein [Solirubrobacteraceae bacterium]|jgi:diguanylate cyclase (GGDEF)-like protein/PAS domain S-box-containing protein|nr:EAL domain-containing protein [Solirubrobacteraceae bacterium]
MTTTDPLRILLVEDDEDDYVLTQSMLLANGRARYDVDWEQSYADALQATRTTRHDLYLVDYRLGEHTGLDLVRTAWGTDPPAPVILLTGQDDYAVDLEATALGVTDYLVKGTIDGPSLERTIRYAVRQHQAMLDLRRSEERYAVAVRATNDGIWDWDLTTGRVHFSDRWRDLLGHEQLPADDAGTWFALVHPDDVERLRREIDESVAGHNPHFENEHRIRHGDGSWRWVLSRGLTTCDAAGTPVRLTGSLSDITERRNAEQQLIHDALHDSLTGLPNRTLLMDRITQCLRHGDRSPAGGCAVLYIDLDRFKLVNDSVSHAAGDRLLVEVARRMERVLRPGDTLARLGGDEFAVVLEHITATSQAREIAARLCQTIADPLVFERRALSIVASIGIAHTLDAPADAEDLLRNADIAMYDAKTRGGGRYRVFDASMHQRVVDRMSLETQLRQAIDQRRLRTFFQPIVDLGTGTLRGLEALARWPDGEHEIPPAEFIPVAEESGLIDRLGRLVLRDACLTLSDWRRQGLVAPEVTISVNVSIRQITDAGLVQDVRAALTEAELPPSCLVLEITESTLIENAQLVRAVLADLLELGVTVELDDFGTGYSSLTVLHDFPGDTLKIDRAFVETMIERAESETIVRSIVGLAHSLGLKVTAEGIEDVDQLEALTALGCEFGQGFHFSRPLPADEIAALLADLRPELRRNGASRV